MRFLRANTAAVVTLGPFVDQTDGYTLETALSATSNTIEIFKSEATAALDVSSRTLAHISGGVYRISLLAADLDTPGPLKLHAHLSGARPMMETFNVLSQTAYDALISGSAMPANMTQVVGNATAATLAVFGFTTIKNFTVGSGSTTTRIATNLTEAQSSHWVGRTVVFTSGSLAGMATSITGYNGTTKELEVAALPQAPGSGDIAVIG